MKAPRTKTEFRELLKNGGRTRLLNQGFRIWERYKSKKHTPHLKKGEALLLIPGKYYDLIPERFPLITLFGSKIKFRHGQTDNDTRFGLLAYGIAK